MSYKYPFELNGSYTEDEIREQVDVRYVKYDKEIDGYLAQSRDEAFFFTYTDIIDNVRMYRYVGGQEAYDETFG